MRSCERKEHVQGIAHFSPASQIRVRISFVVLDYASLTANRFLQRVLD
jgi:hypothetical protein